MGKIRLDKYLSGMGLGTRSEVKKLLRRKFVTVNGVAAVQPEQKIDPETDTVQCNGELLTYEPFVGLMFHKPAGCITATQDGRQKTVMEYIDHVRKAELFPVGRLDIDTEGLLFLINDGDLAHRMLTPKRHVEKTYFVRAAGRLDEADVQAFLEGVDIGEKHRTLPAKLRILKNGSTTVRTLDKDGQEQNTSESYCEAELTICEGKFHQVKRMFAARGKHVVYLKRTAMAGISLDSTLNPGQWRELTKEEIERLRASC